MLRQVICEIQLLDIDRDYHRHIDCSVFRFNEIRTYAIPRESIKVSKTSRQIGSPLLLSTLEYVPHVRTDCVFFANLIDNTSNISFYVRVKVAHGYILHLK